MKYLDDEPIEKLEKVLINQIDKLCDDSALDKPEVLNNLIARNRAILENVQSYLNIQHLILDELRVEIDVLRD